jgi:ABC-type nitrate/sulfonate/bicarbonate transport system substrate-binding protein
LSGAGTIVYDARRDCRADAGFNYTLPSIATTERLISDMPEAAAAAVRAIGNTLIELKQNVGRAAEAAKRVFPDYESSLIVELVRRDLPFYESNITENFVAEMNRFARNTGILKADAAYDKVVAVEFRQLWTA